jgi:hypothetical protein
MLFRLSVSTEENPVFSKGDSGGGIICKQGEEQFLTGVFVKSSYNQVVNLGHKQNFINQFLNANENERSSLSVGLTLDPDYQDIIESFFVFENFFQTLRSVLQYPSQNLEDIHMRAPEAVFINSYSGLRDWVRINRPEAFNLFASNQIVSIYYAPSPESILAPGTPHPNVRKLWVSNATDFSVLELNSFATFGEIIDFLRLNPEPIHMAPQHQSPEEGEEEGRE